MNRKILLLWIEMVILLAITINCICTLYEPVEIEPLPEVGTSTPQHSQPALPPVEKLAEIVEPAPPIVEPSPPVDASPVASIEVLYPEYSDEELEILAIIIYQESGGDACSDDTRRKVGSVFLNRVNSPLFPDTFEEVATGKKQYGTLYLTGIKWPDRAANKGEAHAVKRAYAIAEELLISGSILPPNVIWQAEFTQGDGLYCEQDGIYFCYSEVSE